MKSLLHAIAIILFSLHASAQVASSCTPSAALVHAYEDDCRYLAVQHLYTTHSPDTAYIEIPNQYYDTIMAGMAAICNTGAAIFADSIFNNYCIHEYKITYSINVSCDPSLAWAGTAIDTFCHLHGVSFTSGSVYSGSFIVTLTANRVINFKAFGDSLLYFPGIYSYYPAITIGDGNHITYTGGTTQQYVFQLGWGDCMAGCNDWKTWTYSVGSLCNVALVSVTTTGLYPGPAPLRNCNLNPLSIANPTEQNQFNIYPNPATTELHIEASALNDKLPYTFSDMYGRAVYSGNVTKSTLIDIHSLPAGIYLLTINGTYKTKVMKQ